jgi:predicted small lipoprotein YifL
MKWLMLIPMTFLLLACEKQGPLERAGEEIDEAVEDIKAGGETTGNKIEDAIDEDEARKDVEDAVEDVDPK